MTDRCPECGSRTTPYTITTNPPIHGVICYNCGWTHEDITNKIEKEKPVSDNVNKPSHYTQGGIECIDAIRASLGLAEFADYCKGNIIKYIWRYRFKNGIEDLKKAAVYLNWMIDAEEKNEQGRTC
jgi:hypothetical protein